VRGAALALIGVFALVFPCQRDMVGGHVLAENGYAAASREDSAYVVDARRMVSEVVSDNSVGGANRERERNRNLLTWWQTPLNSNTVQLVPLSAQRQWANRLTRTVQ